MAMRSAIVIKSVEKSIRTIEQGVALGDVKKCAAAYRFARQYNKDLPEAPAGLDAYVFVVRVLSLRVELARDALRTA